MPVMLALHDALEAAQAWPRGSLIVSKTVSDDPLAHATAPFVASAPEVCILGKDRILANIAHCQVIRLRPQVKSLLFVLLISWLLSPRPTTSGGVAFYPLTTGSSCFHWGSWSGLGFRGLGVWGGAAAWLPAIAWFGANARRAASSSAVRAVRASWRGHSGRRSTSPVTAEAAGMDRRCAARAPRRWPAQLLAAGEDLSGISRLPGASRDPANSDILFADCDANCGR